MKKELTPTQKRNRYRTLKWTCFIGEFVAVASPFVAIGIVNYDKYFVQYDGTKMSISFFMALAVMGFAIWGIAKKKLQSSYVSMMIIWATMAFIFQMLGEMITDLATIMWFGLIGIAVAQGLDIGSKQADKKMKRIVEGMEEANKEEIKEAYKQEKLAKKEKVRIRVKKTESKEE